MFMLWVRGHGGASGISLTFPEVHSLSFSVMHAGVSMIVAYAKWLKLVVTTHSHYLKIIICSCILTAIVYVIFQAISLEEHFAFKLIRMLMLSYFDPKKLLV